MIDSIQVQIVQFVTQPWLPNHENTDLADKDEVLEQC